MGGVWVCIRGTAVGSAWYPADAVMSCRTPLLLLEGTLSPLRAHQGAIATFLELDHADLGRQARGLQAKHTIHTVLEEPVVRLNHVSDNTERRHYRGCHAEATVDSRDRQ